MPLINQVRSLQEQGLSESDIIQNLQEQGFSPREINDAIEQAKIKVAVQDTETGEMQPSVLEQESPVPEQTQEIQEASGQQEYAPYPQQYQQYPQPTYQEYQSYQPASETITEIAEQITDEKISALKNELSQVQDFKLTATRKVEDLNERLRKIEDIIDKLQAAIIGKIGSFSSNIQDIKDEMGMMQESFSKVLNPLVEKAKSARKERQEPVKEARKTKKSDGFEHYLRR